MTHRYIRFTQITDDGETIVHQLPAKFEVCAGCRGNGVRVNPAIDGNGLSAHHFHDDPDFADSYFSGVYDVQCSVCRGERVVAVVDDEHCDPELLELYYAEVEATARFEAECAAERRAEMGYYQ